MPLDPNIILGIKTPDAPNLIGMAKDAMTLKSLSQESQIRGQQISDDQAVRSAYQQNTKVDPDGTPHVDPMGVTMSLMNSGHAPAAITEHTKMVANQNALLDQQLDNQTKRNDFAHALSMSIDLTADDDAKQSQWTAAHQKALAAGLPGADQAPAQYPGDGFVRSMQVHTQSMKDQTDQANKDRDYQLAKQGQDIKQQELGLSLKKNNADQTQQTLAALQSARGNPAVQQAEKDVYSDAKINSLATKYGDPNKLSQMQVNLLHQELAKEATGGVPTQGEFEGVSPNTWVGKSSKAYSEFINHPTPANAAAFVQQAKEYSNGIASDARDLIKQNYQGVIETKKPYLTPSDYANFNQQFMSRVNGTQKPSDWAPDGGKGPAQGETKQWGGKTYSVVGGHWVAQGTGKQAGQ